MSYSGAPSTATSPTKSSRWSNSPKLQKAKPNAKTLSLFVNNKSGTVQKTPSQTFFKNYNSSVANNKPTYSVDLSILHESRIFKNLVQAAERRNQREAKRDPILQDNGEETAVFKCSVRRFASADRVPTRNADEDFKRTKHTGTFNPIYSPRPEEDKPQGVRTFVKVPTEGVEDGFVRCRKFRCTSSDNSRNPITEGDEQSAVFKRWRKAVEASGESKRLNDKKHLFTGDRCETTATRGRVHRDMTLTLGDYDYAAEKETLNTVQSARPLTAFELKMRGSIKDTITYQGNQSYRAETVSDKPTQMSYSTLTEARENTRLFGRKITLRNHC